MSHGAGARTDEGGSQTPSGKIIPGSSSVHQELGDDSNASMLQVLGVEGTGGGR
jgi:hypothetical protein